MTHKPTGKIYIGSLKNDKRWLSYKTSSKIVAPMMTEHPDEWDRQVLIYCDGITHSELITLEQKLIKRMVDTLGWDKMFNRVYKFGFAKSYDESSIDQSYRVDCAKKMNERLKDPEIYKKSCENKRKGWDNPELRKFRSELTKKQLEAGHPMYKGPYTGVHKKTGDIKIYADLNDAVKDGFNKVLIRANCRGEYKSHRNYIWTRG
jgi:hypothetical protein